MKAQPKSKVMKLLKQFPPIEKLIEKEHIAGAPDPAVAIRVQRADPTFLYWRAHNVDGITSYLGPTSDEPEHRGHIATRSEYLVVVNMENTISYKMIWRKRDKQLVKGVFFYESPEKVAYFIWVSVWNWHHDATEEERNKGFHLGHHVNTALEFYVFLPPKEYSFSELLKKASLKENVRLNQRDILDGCLKENKEYLWVGEQLGGLAAFFSHGVYLKGLKKIIDRSPKRGMSGIFGGVRLMTYVSAGRIMFTLQKDNNDITFIGAEDQDDPRMGWQSINATLPEAERMLITFEKAWRNTASDQRKKIFKDDPEVSIF